MNIPDSLRPAFERAEREDTAEAWDALHLACCCFSFPRPVGSPEWEDAINSLPMLTRLAMDNMRSRILARQFASPPASTFDPPTDFGESSI
jgi:hypothetical protein